MKPLPVPANFALKANAFFGAGAASRLPEKLRDLGFKRPGVIIDEVVFRQAPIASLLEAWRQDNLVPAKLFLVRTGLEPDYDYLDAIAAEFRPLDLDLVIGIGGGSAMDLAKGVGVLMRNQGRGMAYRGMNLVPVPGVPVVVIPTVAGCGSEVSETASFIDRASKTKLGINGRHVGCLFAVLDQTLLTTCPGPVTLGSGLDAMVHAVEAVTARTANVLSIFFGAEAVRLLFEALPIAMTEPENLTARAQLLLASFYAGIAMCHAAGGPASGISYPLGVHFNVPHGYAGGVLLPHVVAANVAKGYAEGYARLYERVDGSRVASLTERGKAEAFRDALWNLCRQTGAPETFGRWKVGRTALETLAELTMTQRKGNLELNPVSFGREDVEQILAGVLLK
jgi:alcohol dehydrogenase class IV